MTPEQWGATIALVWILVGLLVALPLCRALYLAGECGDEAHEGDRLGLPPTPLADRHLAESARIDIERAHEDYERMGGAA